LPAVAISDKLKKQLEQQRTEMQLSVRPEPVEGFSGTLSSCTDRFDGLSANGKMLEDFAGPSFSNTLWHTLGVPCRLRMGGR
jgi:hypothetical protein